MPHHKGGDWIRLSTRLAIYARDGFDCLWCRTVFPLDDTGMGLSLDHVVVGGGHRVTNLVTCCGECNSRRQDTGLDEWLARVERTTGVPVAELRARLEDAVRRPLDRAEGMRLAKLRRPGYGWGHAARARRRAGA